MTSDLAACAAGPGESQGAEQLRLANALQQLGCQRVLQTYLEGSTASRTPGELLMLRQISCGLSTSAVIMIFQQEREVSNLLHLG